MQTIMNQVIQYKMEYDNHLLLTYTIHYPHFVSDCSPIYPIEINRYYKAKAQSIENYCRETLFPQAIEQYHYNMEHNYPIMQYEVLVTDTITYNNRCITSLYTDHYFFTGGAHGNTIRTSETWDFQSGKQLPLRTFFPPAPDYTSAILETINKQIQIIITSNPSVYFDNYAELTKEMFHKNNFYLTPSGVMIYFQQYEIAPYSSGIPEFLIPFC